MRIPTMTGRGMGCVAMFLFIAATPRLATAVMPLPTAPEGIPYPAVATPVRNNVPTEARPIGVGTVATDHNLSVSVSLERFTGPVDIYAALYAPAIVPLLLLFDGADGIVPITQDFPTWKNSYTEQVSENLLGTIPLSLLPSGNYAFFLLVVPAGTPASAIGERFYLWTTSVGNLRAADVAGAAAALLGGDVAAGTAVLMASARGYTVEEIADAVTTAQMDGYGNIGLGSLDLQLSTAAKIGLKDICANPDDQYLCQREIQDRLDAMTNGLSGTGDITVTILRAANFGYSADQITAAIVESIFEGNPYGSCDTDGALTVNLAGLIFVCRGDDPFPGLPPDLGWEILGPANTPVNLFSDAAPTGSDTPGDGTGGAPSGTDPFPWVFRGPFTFTWTATVNYQGYTGTQNCVYAGTAEIGLAADGIVGAAFYHQSSSGTLCSTIGTLETSGAHEFSGTAGTVAFAYPAGDVWLDGTYDASALSASGTRQLVQPGTVNNYVVEIKNATRISGPVGPP